MNAETSDGKFRAFILVDGEGEIIQDAMSIDYNGDFLSDNSRWVRDIIDMKKNNYLNDKIDNDVDKKDQNNFLLFIKALQKKGWF